MNGISAPLAVNERLVAIGRCLHLHVAKAICVFRRGLPAQEAVTVIPIADMSFSTIVMKNMSLACCREVFCRTSGGLE
jgi:hypothetical protein